MISRFHFQLSTLHKLRLRDILVYKLKLFSRFIFIIEQEDTWKQLRNNILTCFDKRKKLRFDRQRRHSIIFISKRDSNFSKTSFDLFSDKMFYNLWNKA